jgi:hypothetical protein
MTSAATPPPSTAGARSKFERFDAVEIHRSQITNAPYNPRTINDEARKRLRQNIKKIGLVCTLTWNRRTGNLISGHQRLAALDALEGSQDYKLTVSAVDLDPKAEQEQNVFMNNPLTHGDWDIEKLEAMFAGGMEADGAGFDAADVYQLFGDSPAIKSELMTDLAETIRAVGERVEKISKKIGETRDSPHFYTVVVFDSWESRKRLTDKLGVGDNRFIDARLLLAAMGNAALAEKKPDPPADDQK